MGKPADLVRQVAAAVGEHDPQVRQLVECAAEHQVRRHGHRIQRKADQIGEIVGFKAAAVAREMRVRENENLQLLRAFQHRAVAFFGKLIADYSAAEFNCAETVFFDDALEFSNRGVRVLHRQRRHTAQAVGTFRHHVGHTVVGHARCGGRAVGIEIVKINHRRRRDHRNVEALAVHARDLCIGIEKFVEQRSRMAVFAQEFLAGRRIREMHAVVVRARPYQVEHFAREHVAVHVDAPGFGHGGFPSIFLSATLMQSAHFRRQAQPHVEQGNAVAE